MFNIDDCNQEMELSIDAFKSDLKNIRTGRVSPDILKTIIIAKLVPKKSAILNIGIKFKLTSNL